LLRRVTAPIVAPIEPGVPDSNGYCGLRNYPWNLNRIMPAEGRLERNGASTADPRVGSSFLGIRIVEAES
jgi:hypothetical protein